MQKSREYPPLHTRDYPDLIWVRSPCAARNELWVHYSHCGPCLTNRWIEYGHLCFLNFASTHVHTSCAFSSRDKLKLYLISLNILYSKHSLSLHILLKHAAPFSNNTGSSHLFPYFQSSFTSNHHFLLFGFLFCANRFVFLPSSKNFTMRTKMGGCVSVEPRGNARLQGRGKKGTAEKTKNKSKAKAKKSSSTQSSVDPKTSHRAAAALVMSNPFFWSIACLTGRLQSWIEPRKEPVGVPSSHLFRKSA